MQNVLKAVLILAFGGVIGYFISNITTLSIYELKTPLTSSDGGDLAAQNNTSLTSFAGAWSVASGSGTMNELNSVAVHCWKDKGECNVAEANVLFSDLFTNTISYFQITEWSQSGQITAVKNTYCEDHILKIDVKSKVVTLTESRKGNVDENACPQSDAPTVLTLGQKGF